MVEKEKLLSYKQIGNKDSKLSLIFLHGSTMTKEGMLPFVEKFVDWNCIVFDLTAHGESAGEEPKEISEFAEDVENSIHYLQQQRVIGNRLVIIGYSMGGAITCEIALQKKLKLAGMVLLGSGADLSSYTPLVDELKKISIKEFESSSLFSYMFGTDTSEEEKKAIIQLLNVTKVADEIGYGDLMASNQYNRLSECINIDIPVFLIQGNDDRIVLPMAAIETWKTIPNSELLMIPYKGHAALIEDKELVKEKITSFLEKL